MGIFGRIRRWFTGRPAGRTPTTPLSPIPAPSSFGQPQDSPDWGRAFGADTEGTTVSNDGYNFSWYIAGYKPIRGERENLEDDPSRILTDRELRNADYIVVHFSGAAGYRTFTSGPWDDWEDLWAMIGDFYDVYAA